MRPQSDLYRVVLPCTVCSLKGPDPHSQALNASLVRCPFIEDDCRAPVPLALSDRSNPQEQPLSLQGLIVLESE